MKTTTINLNTPAGMREFRGYAFGILAVHHDVASQDAGRRPDGWVVSHLPTGCVIQHVASFKAGREFVAAIADMDWNSVEDRRNVPAAIRAEVIKRRSALGYLSAHDII